MAAWMQPGLPLGRRSGPYGHVPGRGAGTARPARGGAARARGARGRPGPGQHRLPRAAHAQRLGRMFGPPPLAEFAHHVETAFEPVRAGAPASAELVGAMLRATDHLKTLLERAAEVDPAATAALVEDLRQAVAAGPAAREVPRRLPATRRRPGRSDFGWRRPRSSSGSSRRCCWTSCASSAPAGSCR